MSQIIAKIAKKTAKRSTAKPKSNRFKTSIYVDKDSFEAFRDVLEKDENVSRVLEEFMRSFAEARKARG